MAPALSARQCNAGGSGTLTRWGKTLVNVRVFVLRVEARENRHLEQPPFIPISKRCQWKVKMVLLLN